MTVVNVKHSGASDPKINTIRDRFIKDVMRSAETKGSIVSKLQKISVQGMTLLKKTYNSGECQAQQYLRSQNQYHQG